MIAAHAGGPSSAGDRLAVGLISGTSMDGVDAALVSCGGDPEARPWVLAYRHQPLPEQLVARLRDCAAGGSTTEVALLHVEVGEAFATAVLELLDECGVDPATVRCIGSHGQTLVHLPASSRPAATEARATLQIGCPAVIAARTGIVTVADFRAMDVALGGQGAPLVPLLDWRCFAHPARGRVLLNLGGIANLTALPPGVSREGVVAFDTGPANVLLDEACRRRGVPAGFDRDGELGAAGRVDQALLERLQAHPFYFQAPPKSADTRDFLGDADALFAGADELSTIDLLATLAELTATTVTAAVRSWVAPAQPVDEVFVSGGGVHNAAVMDALRRQLPGDVRRLPDEAGIPADAKEAAAFAYLALETLAGRPGSLPGATGARRAAVLGSVVSPP